MYEGTLTAPVRPSNWNRIEFELGGADHTMTELIQTAIANAQPLGDRAEAECPLCGTLHTDLPPHVGSDECGRILVDLAIARRCFE